MHTPIFISIFLTQKKNIPKIFCFKRKTKEYLKKNVKYILQKLESAKIHKTFDNCWQRFFWVRKNFCFHKHFISNTFFVFFFWHRKSSSKNQFWASGSQAIFFVFRYAFIHILFGFPAFLTLTLHTLYWKNSPSSDRWQSASGEDMKRIGFPSLLLFFSLVYFAILYLWNVRRVEKREKKMLKLQ